MKAGLVSISFRQLSPGQIISLVAECGLQGIEWGGDVHVPHGDLELAGEVARLTADAGLEVASYGSYYRFEECDFDSEKGGASMECVLDTAEALGAPAIRVWAGQRGTHETSPEVFAAIAGRAREFAESAAARGMRLDFEYHENTLTDSPEATIKLLQAVGHASARTLWQPPLKTSPEERLAGLRMLQPWISNIHCNHFGQNAWPDILPLAEGAEEWSPYLNVISRLPGDPWIMVEHVRDHSPDCFREDADALKQWLSAK
jgi:sugar phosphate isomerase/epimerase